MLAIESKLVDEAIANYMTVSCASHTLSGNRIFYLNDLAEHFHVTEEYIIAHKDSIMYELNGDIIAESDFYLEPDGVYVFDITMFLDYCGLSEEDD